MLLCSGKSQESFWFVPEKGPSCQAPSSYRALPLAPEESKLVVVCNRSEFDHPAPAGLNTRLNKTVILFVNVLIKRVPSFET